MNLMTKIIYLKWSVYIYVYIHTILKLHTIYAFYCLCRIYMHVNVSNDVYTYVSMYVNWNAMFIKGYYIRRSNSDHT